MIFIQRRETNRRVSSRIKHDVRFVIALVLFIVAPVAWGQTLPLKARPLVEDRVTLGAYYLDVGSVALPAGFTGVVQEVRPDGTFGYFESKDGLLKIGWHSGKSFYIGNGKRNEDIMTESVEDGAEGPVYFTAYKVPAEYPDYKYKSGEGKILFARIGSLEFGSFIKSKEDEEVFRAIVLSHKKEKGSRYLPMRPID